MNPTAYFYDAEGIERSVRELNDLDLQELMTIFDSIGFVPQKTIYVYPDTPTTTENYGGHTYELFILKNYFDAATEFVHSRKFNDLSGYLVTVSNQGENDFITNLLTNHGADGVWLGAKDDFEEGHWKWIVGPEQGTKFWEGSTDGHSVGAYVNWKEGEPNNVDNEDCAVVLSSGQWNDAVCGKEKMSLLIEYGNDPLEVTEEKTDL